jgi:hypothetical protein
MSMNILKTVLTVLSYSSAIGGPIVAATGVGMPVGVLLGGVGAAAAVWLHFLDSPRKPQDVATAIAQTLPIAQNTAQGIKKP